MNFKELKQTEKQICRDFIRQFEYLRKLNQFEKKMYIFHVINEQGSNTVAYTKSLFSIGMKPGVADYCVMIEGGRVAFLEFKRNSKSPISASQKNFCEICGILGISYAVAWNVEDAISWLKTL